MKTLKSTLGGSLLAQKVEIGKTEKNIVAVEAASQRIDSKMEITNNDSKRITLDVPMDIYPKLKNHVFEEGTTLRTYLLSLIKTDLRLP